MTLDYEIRVREIKRVVLDMDASTAKDVFNAIAGWVSFNEDKSVKNLELNTALTRLAADIYKQIKCS